MSLLCVRFPESYTFSWIPYGFISCHTLLECGWLRVVRDQRRPGREPPYSHTLKRSVRTILTPLSSGMRPEVSTYTDERGKPVYAATQPFGHLVMIGTEPKSSWRRWRALTETQPTGQSLMGGGGDGGDDRGMDAPLRKSQASWVVSKAAPPRLS